MHTFAILEYVICVLWDTKLL